MQPIEIDGHAFELLRDRDQGDFHRLSFAGKVTCLEKRVEGILIDPCRREFARAIPERTATGLVLVTAVCAGISAASTFLNGRQAPPGQDGHYFKGFITAYMNPTLDSAGPTGFTSWADWLYKDVRCGLAHNFTILTGGMQLENACSYVRMASHGPEIHAPTFLDDFASGWATYLAAVRSSANGDLGRRFQDRFDQIFRDQPSPI
jgi:hypothetical protein